MRYVVIRQGRTYAISDTATGRVVEAGFFSFASARAACQQWQAAPLPALAVAS